MCQFAATKKNTILIFQLFYNNNNFFVAVIWHISYNLSSNETQNITGISYVYQLLHIVG